MYNYAAFSWNSKNPSQTAAAKRLGRLLLSTSPHWQCVLDTPGLRVFHEPQPASARHAYVLERDTGVILGKLFPSDFDENRIPPDPTFKGNELDSLITSHGRHLVERYWGHYVAFLRTPDGRRRFILRDPTGGLPCFLVKSAGVDVALSDMEDCVRLKLTPFSINWKHLTAFFKNDRIVSKSTGFNEVTQLYGGECLAMEDYQETTNDTRSFYWTPVDVYKARSIEDPDEARAALRNVIQRSVSAWGSSYKSIVHELSGGLDSSIVAACLGKGSADPQVLCFHFYTDMSEGDERQYARSAARSAGHELIEREALVSEESLEAQLNSKRLATPAVLGFIPPTEVLKQRLIAERHAGAVSTGQGGDHLFQAERSMMIAADYAYLHGLRPRLFEVASDTSHLTDNSFFSVFSTAIRHGLLRKYVDPYSRFKVQPVLSAEALRSLHPDTYTHPWVINAGPLPPAKLQQIVDVVDCQLFYLLHSSSADWLHPLISQPIIECCLQIPTYVLARTGRNRQLVREAFSADVPAEIVNRYSKGGTTSYFNQLFIQNAEFLREFLFDGELVRNGLLDRKQLEQLLTERALILGDDLHPILAAVRAEKWLSTWTDVRQRTAA